MNMTIKEMQKECRKLAREANATFKKHSHKINNKPAYYFIDRDSGRVLLENCTIASAYENLLCGYISETNRK